MNDSHKHKARSASLARIKAQRAHYKNLDHLSHALINGDRAALSHAITLVESSREDDFQESRQIIERCLPHSGNSIRVGITGVPGVGKSTFIEAIGGNIIAQGHKLGVLAIDPSSHRSGGSILGDKTRMETLSVHPDTFIRPTPSRGALGGVARATRESIILCEAAGFDVIFIETVGVGQSETAVHSMVDFFLLLMLAGAGDELQGIKRGIMEMADAIAITKVDGNNVDKAKLARKAYENALHLMPPSSSGWTPPVLTCSAINKEGIDNVWKTILDHHQMMKSSGILSLKRSNQDIDWLHQAINGLLASRIDKDPDSKKLLSELEEKVRTKEIAPFTAADQMVRAILDD